MSLETPGFVASDVGPVGGGVVLRVWSWFDEAACADGNAPNNAMPSANAAAIDVNVLDVVISVSSVG